MSNENSNDTAAQIIDRDIGGRVRRLRKVRGLSLSEVSVRAGLSQGFISQIERGISSASIRAFARIAEALDVSLGEIFQSGEGEFQSGFGVTRSERRNIVRFPEMSASKEMLTPFLLTPRLDMYILTMELGGRSGEEPFSHKGMEAGYILDGAIELVVNGRREILSSGDSFIFESTKSHRYANVGLVRARAIWINYAND